MIIDRKPFDLAEAALRQLIDGGTSLGDALRVLHNERKIGTMFLIPAVVTVCGFEKSVAMRTIVHETSPYARPADAERPPSNASLERTREG